ncbi:MAG TPA: thiamine phosphate synthase [Beijerinckiaceae bacterium]|jgi:thiamine-phosphate pyrophosphorylase|nr:thiamine phosphate synthase [Beijerinckiaceae bacterium]
MTEPLARLYLLSPPITHADDFAPRLVEACSAGGIAAVLLRFAAADERTLVNGVKILAPLAQESGAAALIAAEETADLAAVATRGGADGVHAAGGSADARRLRERLRDRIVGAGNIRSRHDAMELGEAGVDYVMFGEPRADGSLPALEAVVERATWWAEIFETPCVAYAPSLAAMSDLMSTGAEFVALADAVWSHPDGPAAAVAVALARCAAEAAG